MWQKNFVPGYRVSLFYNTPAKIRSTFELTKIDCRHLKKSIFQLLIFVVINTKIQDNEVKLGTASVAKEI